MFTATGWWLETLSQISNFRLTGMIQRAVPLVVATKLDLLAQAMGLAPEFIQPRCIHDLLTSERTIYFIFILDPFLALTHGVQRC